MCWAGVSPSPGWAPAHTAAGAAALLGCWLLCSTSQALPFHLELAQFSREPQERRALLLALGETIPAPSQIS